MKKKEEDQYVMLPGMGDYELTEEEKASKFISNLMNEGWVGKNTSYLTNYINSDMSIALANIKDSYINYVVNGTWEEEKFKRVLDEIVNRAWILSFGGFMKIGIDYDDGKLKEPKVNVFQESYGDMSDEDLLKLLEKNY